MVYSRQLEFALIYLLSLPLKFYLVNLVKVQGWFICSKSFSGLRIFQMGQPLDYGVVIWSIWIYSFFQNQCLSYQLARPWYWIFDLSFIIKRGPFAISSYQIYSDCIYWMINPCKILLMERHRLTFKFLATPMHDELMIQSSFSIKGSLPFSFFFWHMIKYQM